MELRLYDTMTKEKRLFEPLDRSNVRMYVCGPTVYDYAHIGNARPVIVFDVLFRLLRLMAEQGVWDGGKGTTQVTYVRNITDVDDKIIDRARIDHKLLPLNEAIRLVTEGTANQFHKDVAALGTLEPTEEPRATDFVTPRADQRTCMVSLIERLILRGNAYVAGGEVLFDTRSMPEYGRLSGRKLDEQRPGARVAVDAHKRSPLDFVLWKLSAPDEPGWDSPWGRGRPGWHIECSAMSAAYLGTVFDIHGGGLDLIFPHHENEIAQSTCAHDTSTMANFWMHNGFVEVEGEKMSKSLGNFRTIADLLEDWQGEVVRYQMLMTHYRQPLDWTESNSREAQAMVDRWYQFLRDSDDIEGEGVDESVLAPLLDDLNTPEALMRLSPLFDRAKKSREAARLFVGTARFLGFFNHTSAEYFSFYNEVGGIAPRSSPLIVETLKAVRDEARRNKDFEKSDYLRNLIYLYGSRVADASEHSEIIPAQRDFFSLSANARAKLAAAVRTALASDDSNVSANRPLSEYGFAGQYGLIFNYSPAFNDALQDAFVALDADIKSGAIAMEDLRDAIVAVVLSNRAKAARFGPDIVASAALLRLFSGVVKNYDAFFDNDIVILPDHTNWRIGDVAISDRSTLSNFLNSEMQSRLEGLSSLDASTKQVFHVKIESSPAALRHRALMLIRAFITATRLITYLSKDKPSLLVPPIGSLEPSVRGQRSQELLRFAKSTDGTISLPGRRHSIPYRLSKEFIESFQHNPLVGRFAKIVSLDLYSSTTRELFALDQLCRARTADDPTERFHWNIRAALTFCGTDDAPTSSLRDALEVKLATVGVVGKQAASWLRQAERLSRLSEKPGFAVASDAASAQNFAEMIVVLLLDRDPKFSS